ncbi:MAG TPA: ABC transporter permease [Gammaproteobacteria bacterium]|nr:ABC transporter permease [Gammaproteobacteria bacterium]
MRHTLLIARREFVENAKTKGFWIGIFMLPVIFAIAIGISTWLARAESARQFVVVDQSGVFSEPIERSVERAYQRSVLQALGQYVQQNRRSELRQDVDLAAIPADGGAVADQAAVEAFMAAGGQDAFLARVKPLLKDGAPAFEAPTRRFARVALPEGIDAAASVEEILAGLRPYLTGDRPIAVDGGQSRLFAALLIGPGALDQVTGSGRSAAGEAAIQYWSTNLIDGDLSELIRGALNDEARRRLYVARGVDVATVREIEETRVRVGAFDPAKAEGEETVSIADRIVRNAPIGFVYLLWISIFTVMQMLLNNTIEEKSNRIVDVLLSSVTPNEIMMGKLLGIAGVGFTMVATWLVTAFVGLQFYQGAGVEVIRPALDAVAASGLVPMFLLCFLFGYLIYAGIFLSLGALCNDLKEAQSLQGPMMMIMMVPLFTMVFVTRDPHGTFAMIMTWIPIYTPFTMMNRAAADPPLIEVIGAITLMIVTSLLVLWLAGRVFRIGILRSGNRPKLAEVVQWLRGRADA